MADKADQKPTTTIQTFSGHKITIDEEDLERVNKHKWRILKSATGRLRVITTLQDPDGKKRTVTLGKFLMDPPAGMQVYPRRFNSGLDYRKDNLVVCTVKDRQRLLPKRRAKASSIYRGVSFSQADSRWKAGITVDGKSINLGYYDSEDEAALAYNKAAKKHFGDVAYQNNIHKRAGRKNEES